MKKELYILATGVMARALAWGLKDEYQVYMVGRNIQSLDDLAKEGFKTLHYHDFNAEGKDIILAFKPYALDSVASCIKAKARLVISVLAGKALKELECIQAHNHVRIMPNTAARYKASTTPFICKNELFKNELLEILNTFGKAFELEKEEQMNAAMALSGCAPAFLAIVAESMANAGVYEGLKKDLSYELTRSLFHSFANLFDKEHPALIKENICSPGGVSIKGVKVLEDKALRAAFFEAISASAKK